MFSCGNSEALSKVQLKNLNDFISDTGMFGGISRSFYNLLDIRKYYRQSVKAIETGKHLKYEKVLFFYDDYILQNILQLCSEEEALKEFCHPSIFILMEYDSKNKTSYVKNLYSYIMNFKSPSELSVLMHVHRNTLYYRINKIEEIMNIDLSNVDDFFSMYLSFKILEYIGEEIF